MKRAVVLLSGGLDSATTLYLARKQGYRCLCLIFDYGQRHRREIRSAKRLVRAAGCQAQVVRIRLPWKGSALLDRGLRIPSGRAGKMRGIPLTYVPARNIIFLSFALSAAEANGSSVIFIGANAVDFSGYPDCRPAFYEAFKDVIKTGTKAGLSRRKITISAPLLNMSKAQIVRLGMRLKVPYGLTWSCYEGGKSPCARCDSCLLRQKGFKEAGFKDPLWK
jgi:7-cyano-7-deazaguanine synthase